MYYVPQAQWVRNDFYKLETSRSTTNRSLLLSAESIRKTTGGSNVSLLELFVTRIFYSVLAGLRRFASTMTF